MLLLQMWLVSKRVNRSAAGVNDPTVLDPIELPAACAPSQRTRAPLDERPFPEQKLQFLKSQAADLQLFQQENTR
jgi:hypothetical protein